MSSPRPLVLASASPARLGLLRAAGLDPIVIVSGIDEDIIDELTPLEAVTTLAVAKAEAVSARPGLPPAAIVIGCDSMLEINGLLHGKPADAAEAEHRWLNMRGQVGTLHTGHCLIDTASGQRVSAAASTTLRFGNPQDHEISSYVATGEPLAVAGAFTLDGRSAVWIESIEGDPSTVIGLSMPTLQRLLIELGTSIVEWWPSQR